MFLARRAVVLAKKMVNSIIKSEVLSLFVSKNVKILT
jgi:hypothetical protein